MGYSTAARNMMMDAFNGVNPTTPVTHLSLHTADPGDTGANEVTGGSYARQATDFGAASAGAITGVAEKVFDVPATTVAYVGYWSAVTGGTFLGSDQVTAEVFTAPGQYKVTSETLDLNLTT